MRTPSDYCNPAGETPSQVANYLLADMRIRFRGDAGGQLLCDALQAGIIGAIKEAVDAHRPEEPSHVNEEPA